MSNNGIQRVTFDYVEVAGDVLEGITVQNPAITAYDLDRAKFGWPKRADADMFFTTYIVWRQLVAEKLYAGDFKQFREVDCTALGDYPKTVCQSCDTPAAGDESRYCHKCGDTLPAEDEPRDPEDVDPTRAEAGESFA